MHNMGSDTKNVNKMKEQKFHHQQNIFNKKKAHMHCVSIEPKTTYCEICVLVTIHN
jgi:hypothetical protein